MKKRNLVFIIAVLSFQFFTASAQPIIEKVASFDTSTIHERIEKEVITQVIQSKNTPPADKVQYLSQVTTY
ncbi:MAG: hypothetical protein IPJ81_02475 [Chitinophagaceae bacterium]|nr:hypothetical protein [Chitinophagaceae bacterium]